MKGDCTYCSSLKKAIHNANYCSQEGDEMEDVCTNAYYFKANKLSSGDHVSRLSIRTVSDGYQKYQVDQREYLVDKNKYLIIPKGEVFSSEITTNDPIEGVVVAFSSEDVRSMMKSQSSSDEAMLDDPFYNDNYNLSLIPETIEAKPVFAQLMNAIAVGVKKEITSNLYYQELFQQLLSQVTHDKLEDKVRINSLASRRESTRVEISNRLKIVREYIDGNIHKNLSLDNLSRVATMSKFHLARNFSLYYKRSPHQYIIMKRMERAKFLLRDTNDSLEEIVSQIGLQNSSSFTRLFMKMEGMTTAQYRVQK